MTFLVPNCDYARLNKTVLVLMASLIEGLKHAVTIASSIVTSIHFTLALLEKIVGGSFMQLSTI